MKSFNGFRNFGPPLIRESASFLMLLFPGSAINRYGSGAAFIQPPRRALAPKLRPRGGASPRPPQHFVRSCLAGSRQASRLRYRGGELSRQRPLRAAGSSGCALARCCLVERDLTVEMGGSAAHRTVAEVAGQGPGGGGGGPRASGGGGGSERQAQAAGAL